MMGVSDEEKANALKAIEGLKDSIDGVEGIQSGPDFSGRAGNFTHAAIVTMRDRDVLSAYGPHPAHKAVQQLLHPIVANLQVIDFEPS